MNIAINIQATQGNLRNYMINPNLEISRVELTQNSQAFNIPPVK